MTERYTSKAYQDLPQHMKDAGPSFELDLYELENTPHDHDESKICLQCTLIKTLVLVYRKSKMCDNWKESYKLSSNNCFEQQVLYGEVLLKLTDRVKALEGITNP